DEALARSAESRSRASRSSAPLFGGGEDDDDLYGYGPGSARASAASPPPPEPPEPLAHEIDGGGGWLADDIDYPPPPPMTADPGSGSVPMQHWTEPPSGEVPRILVEDDDLDVPAGDLSAWGSLGAQPRWRDQPTDWEEADFNEDILADEEHRMGALRAPGDQSGPFSFDEPEEDLPPPAPYAGRPPAGRTRISSMPTGPTGMTPRESAGGPGSSELTTRVVTGLVAAAVLVVALVIGPKALVFLVALALTMAVAELYQGLRTQGYHPATLLGLVGTASLVGAVYWRGLDAYPLVIALFVVFTVLWYLAGVVRARPTMNVAVTILAFLYVGFLGSFAALMLKAGSPGVRILVGAIIATVAYDIGAYFVGRWAGKTPLAPAISPNKTVEGMVGASLATLLVCLIVVRSIDPWDAGKAFWLAVVVCVAAPLGDLVESMIKRDLNVKDMGALLPGHGGVLDRIDALLFVVPATYYLVRLVF
ncbi:MAG: phosphatidate cytidylyltransferase, partial [Acidimicrobiales bacterium]